MSYPWRSIHIILLVLFGGISGEQCKVKGLDNFEHIYYGQTFHSPCVVNTHVSSVLIPFFTSWQGTETEPDLSSYIEHMLARQLENVYEEEAVNFANTHYYPNH